MVIKNKFTTFLLTVLASACLCSSASAATFQIDKEHSQFFFRIKHLIGYYITGRFQDFFGTVRINDADQTLAGAQGTIHLNDISTGTEAMDVHLRGEDLFDVQQFKDTKFEVKSVTGKTIAVSLTLKGVTKEVECAYSLTGPLKDRNGKDRLAVSITATINRNDFGLTYAPQSEDGRPLLAETVDLLIDLQAVK